MPPIQPIATHAHTTSRGPSGRNALAKTTAADTPMPGDVAPRRGQELGVVVAILSVHPVPQPRQQRLERGVGEREATSTVTGGLRGEHRQQDEDAHLHEHDGARPSVLAAVQLEVEGAVDPTDPDQGEHDGELADAAKRDVIGEVVGRLRHDGHVHEVVEQLQEADGPPRDRLAMWSRRAPQPAPETAGEPLIRHRVNVAIGRSGDRPTGRSPRRPG